MVEAESELDAKEKAWKIIDEEYLGDGWEEVGSGHDTMLVAGPNGEKHLICIAVRPLESGN